MGGGGMAPHGGQSKSSPSLGSNTSLLLPVEKVVWEINRISEPSSGVGETRAQSGFD